MERRAALRQFTLRRHDRGTGSAQEMSEYVLGALGPDPLRAARLHRHYLISGATSHLRRMLLVQDHKMPKIIGEHDLDPAHDLGSAHQPLR